MLQDRIDQIDMSQSITQNFIDKMRLCLESQARGRTDLMCSLKVNITPVEQSNMCRCIFRQVIFYGLLNFRLMTLL